MQEYWSELPCPPPGDLPHPGIEPRSLTLQVDSLPSELPGKPIVHLGHYNSEMRGGDGGSFCFDWQGCWVVEKLSYLCLYCKHMPINLENNCSEQRHCV